MWHYRPATGIDTGTHQLAQPIHGLAHRLAHSLSPLHMKSTKDTGYPGALPHPHTKSAKDTGYKACHSPTSCVFSGRKGEAGRARDGDRLAAPRANIKTAVGRCIRTGPQHSGQNTSLDPSSAQLKQPTEPHMRSTQRAALPSV